MLLNGYNQLLGAKDQPTCSWQPPDWAEKLGHEDSASTSYGIEILKDGKIIESIPLNSAFLY